MRFLNHLGNVFFAKALSFVLDTHLNGLAVRHEAAVAATTTRAWCAGATISATSIRSAISSCCFRPRIFGLGIIDVPVYYRARTYGATNIHRFRHGLMLLRMTLSGLFRVRVGPWRISEGTNVHP